MVWMLRNKQSVIVLSLMALILATVLWRESTPAKTDRVVGGTFRSIDQNAKPREDGDFRGRYMRVYFGYSSRLDMYPTTLQAMAQALDALGKKADRVVPIFISVDPAREQPASLANVALFGPNCVALTGWPSAG